MRADPAPGTEAVEEGASFVALGWLTLALSALAGHLGSRWVHRHSTWGDGIDALGRACARPQPKGDT